MHIIYFYIFIFFYRLWVTWLNGVTDKKQMKFQIILKLFIQWKEACLLKWIQNALINLRRKSTSTQCKEMRAYTTNTQLIHCNYTWFKICYMCMGSLNKYDIFVPNKKENSTFCLLLFYIFKLCAYKIFQIWQQRRQYRIQINYTNWQLCTQSRDA